VPLKGTFPFLCFLCLPPTSITEILITFLLAYLYRGRHCDISIYAYSVSWLGSPHCHSPSPPSLLLKIILPGFNVLSSYMYIKYINHIHPPLSSSFPCPFPSCFQVPLMWAALLHHVLSTWCSASPQAQNQRLSNHGLKPLQTWAKPNLSSS
jgi:hypothetical protein